jgi:hypothetical protein
LTYSDIPDLQKVVRAVRQLAGAKSSGECGVHIHIDASAFDGRALANLAKIVFRQEDLIIRALGVSGTRLSRFCRRMDTRLIEQIAQRRPRTREQMHRIWYGYSCSNPMHCDPSRYPLLNLHSVWFRNTIEIRAFNGSLHAGEIKAYIQFCLALAAKALNAKGASGARKAHNATSEKHDFRIFLLQLGLIGDEFKTCRRHLIANLAGSAASDSHPPNRKRRHSMSKVKVPRQVLEGLEAVRQSGLTNMLDRPAVIKIAAKFGFEEAARWIETHRKGYAEGIFRGFEPEEGH